MLYHRLIFDEANEFLIWSARLSTLKNRNSQHHSSTEFSVVPLLLFIQIGTYNRTEILFTNIKETNKALGKYIEVGEPYLHIEDKDEIRVIFKKSVDTKKLLGRVMRIVFHNISITKQKSIQLKFID